MFFIKVNLDTYVAGFQSLYQIVQKTTDLSYAKGFRTEKAAQRFIDQYSDCGYGLESDSAYIVEI